MDLNDTQRVAIGAAVDGLYRDGTYAAPKMDKEAARQTFIAAVENGWSFGDLERALSDDKKANIKDYLDASKSLGDARDQIVNALDNLYPSFVPGVEEDLRSAICILEQVASFADAIAKGEEERPSARTYARNRAIIEHLCFAWVDIFGEIPGTSRNAYESKRAKGLGAPGQRFVALVLSVVAGAHEPGRPPFDLINTVIEELNRDDTRAVRSLGYLSVFGAD